MNGSTKFTVRQVFYAGVGWAAAVFCIAFAIALWGSWRSYVLLVLAGVCIYYAVRNVGLAYVLDEEGLTISSRWGTQMQVRWSNVTRMKFFEQGMVLGLLLKDGNRLPIRFGALQEPEVFRREAQRLATVTGIKRGMIS